ncbi:MAG: ROK family protein [Methanosarcinales archaeon]|nr:ROK family protein [Methanosarcinales archaeon]
MKKNVNNSIWYTYEHLGRVSTIEHTYLAAVDIGGTKMTVSLANKEGFIIKVYRHVQLTGNNTTIPEQVDYIINYMCKKAKIKKDEIGALGIGSCGPFNKDRGYLVLVAPNLCGGLVKRRDIIPNDWTGIPLEQVLSQIYSNLTIDNDAITAVMAERLFGAGRGEDDLVYVTWSTGIGSGAFVDGRLIKGKNGNAPHIGHIYLVEDGPQCGCGNFGDMESLCSGEAIARDYGGGATTEMVFLVFNNDDPKAKKVITKAAKNFARGLVSINAILDTKVFIIGGSVFMNNIDILLPMVKYEFYRSFPALSNNVEFRPSTLDKYLVDLGALSLVMPEEWIEEWQKKRPWEYAPKAIVLE